MNPLTSCSCNLLEAWCNSPTDHLQSQLTNPLLNGIKQQAPETSVEHHLGNMQRPQATSSQIMNIY